MPFTPSHAVVALPLVRTPLVPAAVAIGAMAPDLPLFLRGGPISYQATHTSIVLTVLIAAALLALWYVLLRPAVRELTPETLARRLPAEWDAVAMPVWWRGPHLAQRLSSVVLVTVSLTVGVLTHIVWDAFTHEGRWGTKLVPLLAERWGPVDGYTWVQHGSSLFGMCVILLAGALWWRRASVGDRPVRLFPAVVRRMWWGSLPMLLVLGALVGLAVYGPITESWTLQHLAYRVLPPACAVWGGLTLALCGGVVLRRRRTAP